MMAILLALGEDILNLVLFILVFAAGLSAGKCIFDKFNRSGEKIQGLEQFVFSAGLGFGILGYLTLAIGFTGLLYRPVAYFILFLLLVMGIYLNRHLRLNLKVLAKTYIEKFLNLTIFEKILILFILIVSCLNLIAALAPPTGQDTLSSYLAIPKIFLRKHSIFHLGENPVSNWPILPSILYLFGLMLHSGIIGQLIHWLFSVLAALILYAIAKRYSRTIGLLSSAIFLSLQVVIWESSLALTDIATVFYLLLAFYAFIRWFSLENKRWIILAGITGGLAAGCKGLGPIYIGAFTLLIFLDSLSRKGFKFALKIGLLFFGSFLVVASVWYIKAWIMTGNPFFPAFFGGRDITAGYMRILRNYRPSPYAITRDLKSLFLFPINLTFRYHTTHKSGWIGPLFLTFLPLIAFLKEKGDKIIINIFGFSLILLLFVSLLRRSFFIRYYLIIFALLSIPVSISIYRYLKIDKAKMLRVSTKLTVCAWLCFTFSYAVWKKIPNFPVVVGAENRDQYLQSMISEDVNFMQAFKFINKNLPQDMKILYVGSRGYYLDRDYIRFGRLFTGLIDIKKIRNQEDFNNELKKLEITHLLIDLNYQDVRERINHHNQEGSGLWKYLSGLIDSENLTLVYQVKTCYLYEMPIALNKGNQID